MNDCFRIRNVSRELMRRTGRPGHEVRRQENPPGQVPQTGRPGKGPLNALTQIKGFQQNVYLCKSRYSVSVTKYAETLNISRTQITHAASCVIPTA